MIQNIAEIRVGRLAVRTSLPMSPSPSYLDFRMTSANVLKIAHTIRDRVRTAFVIESSRLSTPRAALLESNGDPPRNLYSPSKFSRAYSPETSGMVRVFSPTTLGPFKRRHHPNTVLCSRVAVVKSNTVDLVMLSTKNKGQMLKAIKGGE